ncbi:MAG: hypothetical protein FWD42_06940 [Solirubrobacterales bacterium]|nr:hypothetical protein [Solirubrobacterales bacterium]
MARKSLRPQLNQIRAWVRQGRTDAWVAHQLEVTVQDIAEFKRQNELAGEDELPEGSGGAGEYPEEIDLRAEDDALIAAELEAAALEAATVEAEEEDGEGRGGAEEEEESEAGRARTARPRRRGRRGGRARRSAPDTRPLEGTFDHGEEGYGLWLDPAIQDNPIYAEHWAGHRPIEVSVEEDQIVIRRAHDDG